MKAILFKCPPGGQFHFGRIALDDKTSLDETSSLYHSDTLTSAIVDAAFRVYGTSSEGKGFAEEVLKWFMNGKVKVSSLFHCLQNDDHFLHFLPKPANLDAGEPEEQKGSKETHKKEKPEEEEKEANAKELRAIRFLSKGVWEAGLTPKEWIAPRCRILQRTFVVLEEEWTELGCSSLQEDFFLYKIDTVPKVKIHQPVKEDNLYFHGNIFLSPTSSPQTHFYALIDHSLTDDQWKRLWSVLEIIADEGIGGERSVGCGALEGVEDLGDFTLALAGTSDKSCTLSLVSPKDDVDLARLKAWRITTRGGRHTMLHGDLARLKMVVEGALTDGGLQGDFRDIGISLKGRYFRFGHALTLPLPPKLSSYGGF